MKMNWNAQINKYNEEDDEDTDTIIINEDLFEQREPEINEEEKIIQNEIKSDEFSFFSNNTKRNSIKEKNKNKNEQNLSYLKLKENKNKKVEINDKNGENNLNLIILKTDINNNINNYNIENNNFSNVLLLKKGRNISFKGDDEMKENKNEYAFNLVDKNNNKRKENDELIFQYNLENNNIVKNEIEKEISNSKSKNITDSNNSNYLIDNKRPKNRVKEKYSLKIGKNKYKSNSNNNIINQYKSKLKNNNLKKIIDYSNSNSNIKTSNSNTKINNSNSSRNYQEDINPKYKSAFVGNKNKLKYSNTNRDKEKIKIKNIDLDLHKKNHIKKDYLRYYKERNKNNTSIKKNSKNDNSTHLLYFHNKSQSQSHICLTSQKNSKYRNLHLESKNKTQSEYRDINRNKNKNFTNTNTLNERNKNSVIVLRKKKHEQEAEILKKILIKKINYQIEEIMKGKRKYYLNENNKLFFLGFCDLLFELGFLHIKETEIVDISKINEHIDELYTQPFTNRNLLSEEFLFNEQKLLICAWKTILNNFRLVKEFSELPNEDEEISMDDFKLFIFIIIGIFTGNNIKNFHNNNWAIYKNISPNRLSFKKDSNGKDIRNQLQNKNNSDEKHIFNSNNNSPRENNILKIKDFFKYFAELRKLYNLYKKDLKNINKQINIVNEFTFFPKTNKNNKYILRKFGTPLNFFERSELFKNRNEQKKAKLKLELSKRLFEECTFEPCQNSKSKSKSKNKNNRSLNNNEHKNPFEISNRLYYNYSKHKKNRTEKNTKNNSKNNNSESNRSKNKLTEEKINHSGGRGCSKIFYKSIMNKKNKMKLYNLYDNSNLSNSKMHNSTSTNCNKIIKKEKKFYPDTNKKYNKGMFSHSPLVNDELLNKRINKLRETNYKKFVTNYERNNREIISDSIKKNKEILKQIINKDRGYMFDYLEKKTNKDTFDNFKNYNFYFNNENIKNNNIINEPLFIVEIKIKDNNAKMIEVYKDDIPEKLAYNFCIENLLGSESYERILMIIKSKLDELNNRIINENINYSQNNENKNQKKDNNNDIFNNYNFAKNEEEAPQNDSKIYDINYENDNDNDNMDYFIDNLNPNEDFKNNNIIKTKYTNNLIKDYNNIEKIDENNELSNNFQINSNDENIKENYKSKSNIFNDDYDLVKDDNNFNY